MQWLEDNFLKYLDDWEISVNERQGNFTADDKTKMLLSSETMSGLRMTSITLLYIIIVNNTWKYYL